MCRCTATSSLQRIALRQDPAIVVFRPLQRLLVGDRLDALEERDRVALLDGEAVEVAIAGIARRLVGLDEELGQTLAEIVALEGGEDRFRVEEITAIHLGI